MNAAVTAADPEAWRAEDGTPIACREKRRMLRANEDELREVMQAAFEDAVLMGVDAETYRAHLAGLTRDLASPKRG